MTHNAQPARRQLRPGTSAPNAVFRPRQEESVRSLAGGRGTGRRSMRRLAAALCALMMLAGSAMPAAGRETRLRWWAGGEHYGWDCDYEPTRRAATVTITENTLSTGFRMLCWDEAQTKYARCQEWRGTSRQVWRMTTVGAALAGFEWKSKFDPDGDGVPCEWIVGWAELPDRFYVDLVGGGHIRFDLSPSPTPVPDGPILIRVTPPE